MPNHKLRIAPRIKQGRVPRSSGLHPSVNREVLRLARKFNCSKSFVITSALAEFFKVHGEGRYYE